MTMTLVAPTVADYEASADLATLLVRTTQDDLRDHFADHPVARTLDAYQWMLLLSAHTRRHTAQLNEVKTNPAYPRN